jgi:hypothetical protein
MRPLFEGRKKRLRQHVFSKLGAWRTVFDGRYKLIQGFDPNAVAAPARAKADETIPEDLLFDLREDPTQSRNLAGRAPGIMRELTRHIATV